MPRPAPPRPALAAGTLDRFLLALIVLLWLVPRHLADLGATDPVGALRQLAAWAAAAALAGLFLLARPRPVTSGPPRAAPPGSRSTPVARAAVVAWTGCVRRTDRVRGPLVVLAALAGAATKLALDSTAQPSRAPGTAGPSTAETVTAGLTTAGATAALVYAVLAVVAAVVAFIAAVTAVRSVPPQGAEPSTCAPEADAGVELQPEVSQRRPVNARPGLAGLAGALAATSAVCLLLSLDRGAPYAQATAHPELLALALDARAHSWDVRVFDLDGDHARPRMRGALPAASASTVDVIDVDPGVVERYYPVSSDGSAWLPAGSTDAPAGPRPAGYRVRYSTGDLDLPTLGAASPATLRELVAFAADDVKAFSDADCAGYTGTLDRAGLSRTWEAAAAALPDALLVTFEQPLTDDAALAHAAGYALPDLARPGHRQQTRAVLSDLVDMALPGGPAQVKVCVHDGTISRIDVSAGGAAHRVEYAGRDVPFTFAAHRAVLDAFPPPAHSGTGNVSSRSATGASLVPAVVEPGAGVDAAPPALPPVP